MFVWILSPHQSKGGPLSGSLRKPGNLSLSLTHTLMDSRPENPNTISDIFDSSLNLEDAHFTDGYNEGYNHGLITGKADAQETGLKLGFEAGEELGFYRGCVDVWNSAIRVDPTLFPTRVQKTIKQMEDLVEKYPVLDPENEGVQEIMEGLRLKFKAVCATLGVKLEYKGYPKGAESGGIEF